MKILGVDYGEKKIGLALSEGILAEPFDIIENRNWELEIRRICEEQEIEKIVVGISEGKMAEKTRSFGQMLGKLVGLPVEFQDETLTSKDAVAKMRQVGKKIKDEDAIAAALILQTYLEKEDNV